MGEFVILRLELISKHCAMCILTSCVFNGFNSKNWSKHKHNPLHSKFQGIILFLPLVIMITNNVSEGIVLAIKFFKDLYRIFLVFVSTLIRA